MGKSAKTNATMNAKGFMVTAPVLQCPQIRIPSFPQKRIYQPRVHDAATGSPALRHAGNQKRKHAGDVKPFASFDQHREFKRGRSKACPK